MKNPKITQLLACLILLLFVNIQQSNAITYMDIESLLNTNYSELTNEVLDVMNKYQTIHDAEKVTVEVVDQEFNVIAFGSENEHKIETLIKKSDLLTEITGKKFFRLCYENE